MIYWWWRTSIYVFSYFMGYCLVFPLLSSFWYFSNSSRVTSVDILWAPSLFNHFSYASKLLVLNHYTPVLYIHNILSHDKYNVIRHYLPSFQTLVISHIYTQICCFDGHSSKLFHLYLSQQLMCIEQVTRTVKLFRFFFLKKKWWKYTETIIHSDMNVTTKKKILEANNSRLLS